MAFVTLRRSRNTRSYYLVESYRDEDGRARKRTLCYLGREQDGTNTLEKALAHWRRIEEEAGRGMLTETGQRRHIPENRRGKARQRIELLCLEIERVARVEAARRERRAKQQQEEEAQRRRAEMAEHWQAIDRLHRSPSAEHVQAAKRAFRFLALRLHPDQGGSHAEFIRLKAAHDRAQAAWRRRAGQVP